jgi:carboxypeptidase family protein/TonB-dependent receptor-like protein
MRRKLIFLLAAAVLVITPLAAQEQTGGIEGVVKDADGAVLPGVTIEATSPAIGTVVATTDEAGRYRVPRLPSGVYAVKASLEGYKPAEQQGINLHLGEVLTVNATLQVGSFEETIVVTGEGSQIDVTQSATATSISREQIELIPKGRDFTSIATQAPGVKNSVIAGGLSVDGASGSENRFVIDGIDTTEPVHGMSGQMLITDFVEEVQVKTAGYQAEYGGSVGGVISAVTKSGTNQYDGSVGMYYGDRSWDGSERPTPFQTTATSLYRTFEEDDITRTEPFFTLGGPIVRDKAWFFAGYSYNDIDTNRTPPLQSTKNQGDKTDTYMLNIKGNVGSKFLYKVAANSSERKLDNQLPSRDGTTPETVDLNVDDKFPTDSYSAYADYVPSASFYVSGRVGYYDADQHTTGNFPAARIFFRDRPFPIVGDPRFRPTSFATSPAATAVDTDEFEREAASLDANIFFSGAGSHSLKVGTQYEKVTNTVASGEPYNLYTIRWGLADRFGVGVQGTYGSLGVRNFGTFGEASSENLGFFVQDSWAIRPNFTLNLGVRAEQEDVPNFAHKDDPSAPKNAWSFDYGDKLAPRVGFAWDVNSDQKLKVYGSWGRYYDISKLNIRGSFGGEKWIEYLYPLETLDWQTVANGCSLSTNNPAINPCPGLGSATTINLREPSDPNDPLFGVDPNLKPFEQEEYQLGADYQLTTNTVVGLRYVNKDVKHAIEDLGFAYCDGSACSEGYNIGNPGEGQSAFDPPGVVPAQPKAKREYQAIELNMNRRFADNWSARVAYTYSQLEGNYPGLASSDEFGRTSPNTNRLFDSIHNSFDRFGNQANGKLNSDRPHQIDAQGIYRFGFGMTVGLSEYYGSGTPNSTQVVYAGVPFFAFGRGDAGRTPSITQTDLLITQPFKIGDYTIEASLNVLNLFDEDEAQVLDPTISNQDLCTLWTSAHPADPCNRSQEFFFSHTPWDVNGLLSGAARNPYYLQPNVAGSFTGSPYQTRRTIRLGLKFTF